VSKLIALWRRLWKPKPLTGWSLAYTTAGLAHADGVVSYSKVLLMQHGKRVNAVNLTSFGKHNSAAVSTN
jgi:hypothetical protein